MGHKLSISVVGLTLLAYFIYSQTFLERTQTGTCYEASQESGRRLETPYCDWGSVVPLQH